MNFIFRDISLEILFIFPLSLSPSLPTPFASSSLSSSVDRAGVNCEENLDECLSNPCQNGGSCDDRENGYVCSCTPGYAGLHCEQDVAVCNTGLCDNHLFKYLISNSLDG